VSHAHSDVCETQADPEQLTASSSYVSCVPGAVSAQSLVLIGSHAHFRTLRSDVLLSCHQPRLADGSSVLHQLAAGQLWVSGDLSTLVRPTVPRLMLTCAQHHCWYVAAQLLGKATAANPHYRLSPSVVSPRLHRRDAPQDSPRRNGINGLSGEHQVVGAAAPLTSPVSPAFSLSSR
jgi:hypothetical protein